jgi:hypothetical protein
LAWIILSGFILRNGTGNINSLSQEVPAPTWGTSNKRLRYDVVPLHFFLQGTLLLVCCNRIGLLAIDIFGAEEPFLKNGN